MNKELTEKKSTELQENNPDDIQLLPEEIRVPMAIIIQEKNHLLKKFKDKYKVGQIVEMSTFDVISKEEGENHTLIFIPISGRRVYLCKNPRQTDDKLFDKAFNPNETMWKTTDPSDPRIKEEQDLAKREGARPRVKKYLQFLSYVEGFDMPVLISFGKSSLRAGETLLTTLLFAKTGRKINFWERKYKLVSSLSSYEGNDFYAYSVEKVENKPTADELGLAKDWNETIARQNYEADVDDIAEDDEPAIDVKGEATVVKNSENKPY